MQYRFSNAILVDNSFVDELQSVILVITGDRSGEGVGSLFDGLIVDTELLHMPVLYKS